MANTDDIQYHTKRLLAAMKLNITIYHKISKADNALMQQYIKDWEVVDKQTNTMLKIMRDVTVKNVKLTRKYQDLLASSKSGGV